MTTYVITADGGEYTLTGNSGVNSVTSMTMIGAPLVNLNVNSPPTILLLVQRLIVADNTTYGLTGVAASVAHQRVLVAAVGTYTYTGITANFLTDHIDTGSYIVVGQASTLLFSHVLAAGTETYAQNGVSVGAKAFGVVADPGVFDVIGQDTTMFTGALSFENTGAYALTGHTALLIHTRLPLVASTGTYTLTGKTSVGFRGIRYMHPGVHAYTYNGLVNTRLVAIRTLVGTIPAQYHLTGSALTKLEHGYKVLATTTGHYTETGISNTLLKEFALVLVSKQYTYVGNPVTFVRTKVLNAAHRIFIMGVPNDKLVRGILFHPSTGTYAQTGSVVTLLDNHRIKSPVGVYTDTYNNNPLLHDHIVFVTTNPYTFTTNSLMLSLGLFISGGNDNYVVTGVAAETLKGFGLDITTGLYRLAGVSDVTIRDRIMRVATGTYALTGRPVADRSVFGLDAYLIAIDCS